MKQAKLTKRIPNAKPGNTIVIELGMIFPHAVKIDTVRTDEDGQIIGDGVCVEMEGCSTWRTGEKVSVCLGWKKEG